MALFATRTYKNAAGNILREDQISMSATSDVICTGVNARTYSRQVRPITVSGISDRVVASITVTSSATSADSSADILWIEWTSPSVRCGMSDLPGVGDSV